ncbi:MAG: 4-(cytidine 5'-diphospho)-2-C-methyl-D-erythritol kinase [Desulfatiglandales bacterium]
MKPTHHIETPAKLNIRLKVTGRRPDGYHDLVSIMVPIDLSDRMEIGIARERGIEMTAEGFCVPTDESNLVSRAAQAFLSETGLDCGVFIKLTKRIPVAAGMGGGSSDAAAVLYSLNELFGNPLSQEEVHEMAARLGADVPFFLYCRPSIATGIGDILEPLPHWPESWYVVITPRLEISTAWVYGHLKLELTGHEYEHIIDFLKKDSPAVSHLLENDLEKVTAGRYPVINILKEALRDAGAEGVMMTGSGPTVFGLFSSREEARSAKDHLHSKDLGHVFMATDWKRPPLLEEIRYRSAD